MLYHSEKSLNEIMELMARSKAVIERLQDLEMFDTVFELQDQVFNNKRVLDVQAKLKSRKIFLKQA